MLNHSTFKKLNLYRFDPVAYLLIGELRLTPIIFGFLSFIITDVLGLLTAWVSNTLWSQNDRIGLLNDPIPWMGTLFASTIWGYYLWSYHAINKLTYDLKISDVIETNPPEIDEIVRDIYCEKWRIFLALFSAVFFSILGFLTQFDNKARWVGSGFWPNFVNTIFVFVGIYICSMLVFNLIANIWILHKILGDKSLQVNPFHPDHCGGLRSLSDYSLKTTYLIAFFGVLVGVIELSSPSNYGNWYIRLLIPLYAFLSITCFFGPLWTAHSGMKKSKEELLSQIAQQFKTDYSNAHSKLNDNAEILNQGIEKIQQLRSFYAMTDEFPVWPFDVQIFRRYLLTIPAPILPLLISFLQKLIESLLKK